VGGVLVVVKNLRYKNPTLANSRLALYHLASYSAVLGTCDEKQQEFLQGPVKDE